MEKEEIKKLLKLGLELRSSVIFTTSLEEKLLRLLYKDDETLNQDLVSAISKISTYPMPLNLFKDHLHATRLEALGIKDMTTILEVLVGYLNIEKEVYRKTLSEIDASLPDLLISTNNEMVMKLLAIATLRLNPEILD